MDKQEEITDVLKTYIVTQFIHPNYFILFNPNLRDNNDTKQQMEKNLENEIKLFNIPGTLKNFKKGDLVAYYWHEGTRYIRCTIDDVIIFNLVTHYFLFAIDYGVSLYSTKPENIYTVSEIVKFYKTPIMNKVSLKVLPIISRFDYIENKEIIFYTEKWCERALKIFQQSISKAAVITFEISEELPGYKGFLFGDLKITSFYGMVISLCETLVEAKVAKYPEKHEFAKNFDKVLSRNIERWNDNDKTGGILKLGEGQFPLYYDDEILMKQYIANCETVQNRASSVQKVLEWQQKIEGFEHMLPDIDSEVSFETSESNAAVRHDDEGFDEKIVKKKPIFLTKFGVMKNTKQDNRDKMSIISGISKSISQIVPRSEKWISKPSTSAKVNLEN